VQELQLEARVLGGEALNTQPSLAFWPADNGPGHQTFGTRGGADSVPDKGTPEPVDNPKQSWGQLEHAHGEDGQSVQDRVQQHNPTGGREQDCAPPRKVAINLSNQRSKVLQLEFLSRERQTEICLGEALDTASKGSLNLIHILGIDVHWHQGTFMEIDREPRGLGKLVQQKLETGSDRLAGTHDDQSVVSVLQDWAGGTNNQGVT
jgi:hypothetical protein